MSEEIRVGYRPVSGNTLGIYHKYIVYTNSAGQEFYIGFYPENYTSEAQLEAGGFGNIEPRSGELVEVRSFNRVCNLREERSC